MHFLSDWHSLGDHDEVLLKRAETVPVEMDSVESTAAVPSVDGNYDKLTGGYLRHDA